MSLFGSTPSTPPIQPVRREPTIISNEVKTATEDELERRRRIVANRAKSRLKLPSLQETAGSGLSDRL